MSEQKKCKIKIVGKGMNARTGWRVFDAETDQHIEWVRRVEVIVDPEKNIVEAVLYVTAPDVEIEVEAFVTAEQRAQDERIVSAVIAGVKRLIERTLGGRILP